MKNILNIIGLKSHKSPSPSSPPIEGRGKVLPSPLAGEGKGEGVLLIYSLVILSLVILSAPLASEAGEYLIGDEDVLQISVWGNQELNVQVPVRPDGMISVPLIGDVKAAGLKPQELKEIIEKEYSRFVKAPTVSVIVTAVNSFKVYVLGEGLAGGGAQGASAGVITLKRNTTLMQLLAQIGNLSNADLNNAYVLRDGKKLSADLYKLKVKGDISQDIMLSPNDLVFIPDNFYKRIKVVGAVKTPGIIPYREGLTALDAVLNSGGFNEFAKQNEVTIVRTEGKEVKNIEAKLKDLTRDGDISKDVLLNPGDLIIVKTGVF